MSTYSVVVALHIIAVVAAYGLPLTAPLLVPPDELSMGAKPFA